MSVITVNAIGDTCPVPVIKAKQALAQMTEPGGLVVLVDNEVAVQNLTRMGASQGYAVQSEKTGDGNFQVRILVNALPQPEESAAPASEEAPAAEQLAVPAAPPEPEPPKPAVNDDDWDILERIFSKKR